MAVVKCCWSGGKDSTCAILYHLDDGDKCIIVNYVPMFTDSIPLLLKDHYEFIMQTIELWRSMGADVYQVSGLTYWDYVHKIATKGPNKGLPFGFPWFGRGACGFKRDSKEKALRDLDFKFNLKYDYEDIGIAFDEVDRHFQLNYFKRSILVEREVTEFMAREVCMSRGLYSPHYFRFKRDGCTLCPQAISFERREWFSQYPEAFDLVLELQDFVRQYKPDQFPLRNYKYFIEEDMQLSIFDDGISYIIN